MARLNFFKWPIGKSYLMGWHLTLFPKNHTELTFVDPFGGALNSIILKKEAKKEIVGELDQNLCFLYEAVKSCPATFYHAVNIPYTQEYFEVWRDSVLESPFELAVREYIVRNCSRGGLGKDFCWSERKRGGRPGDLNNYYNKIENIDKISKRIARLHILNKDFRETLDLFDDENMLVYADPCYVPKTRVSKKMVKHEMTLNDHVELLDILNKRKSKVFLCGYDNPLYKEKLTNWNLYQKPIASHGGQTKKKTKKLECVWTNY